MFSKFFEELVIGQATISVLVISRQFEVL